MANPQSSCFSYSDVCINYKKDSDENDKDKSKMLYCVTPPYAFMA
jgi:hypothetical protein